MVEKYPILVISPIIGASVNIFAHLAMSRLKKGRSQMICLIASFAIGLIIMSFFALLAYDAQSNILNFLAYLLLDIIAYTAFSYGYFHFININIASLRIRILHEIGNSPEGLLKEEILNRYSAKQVIENRLRRLMDSNQLIEKNGYYFLGKNRTFLILFWLFEVLKCVILGKGNRLLNEGRP